MANQEHLEILNQGVDIWNQWRKEHRDVTPDFRGADLTGAQLNDVRLSFSQLAEARFSDAHLQRAYFVSSDLSYANFSRADQDFAHQLQTDLQAHGVLCESTPYDVEWEKVDKLIQAPMVIHDMLLLVISEYSETEISRQALNGIVKEALVKERKGFIPILLPIHLGKAPQAQQGMWARLLRMAQYQSRDFTRWHDSDFYRAAFAQLLDNLKAEFV